MRIYLLPTIALLCLVLASRAVAAPLPDPARLDADWWTYFAPEEALSDDDLQRRIEDAGKALDQLEAGLDADQKAELLPTVARLREALNSFLASRAKRDTPPTVLPPPQESYTLDEVFARHKELLALTADVDLERDELTWRRDLLSAERKQQSRSKVSYLESPDTDPSRLQMGLELMVSRVQLELDALEIERRDKRLDLLTRQQTDLTAQLDGVAARLAVTPEERAKWAKTREEALAEAAQLQEEGISAANGKLPDATVGERETRITALRVLQRDLRVKSAELLAARAQLIEALITFVTTEGTGPEALSTLIDQTREQLKSLVPRQKYWKGAVARAQGMLSGISPDVAQVSAADRRPATEMQQLITAISESNAAVVLQRQRLELAMNLAERRIRLGDSAVQRGWTETIEVVKNSWDSTYALLTLSMFEINDTPVTLFGLLRVLVIVSVAWLLSKGVRRGLQKLTEKSVTVSQSSLYTLGRVSHYLILVIGVLIGLSSIGIDFTKFALLASALGIGIGFGMQALVSNFVAGLIILFEKSLKVGDFVELQSGINGEVKEINMRSTLITTNDNVDILVPNSDFINKEVTNWTLREAFRRIRVPFGVAYGTDKERVRKAALEAADDVRWTLKDDKRRAPQVWFVNFGDSSLDFELVVWLVPEAVKRPSAVQAAYLWEIESKLTAYGIEVPFPQRDLHLRSGFDAITEGADATK